MYVYFNPNPSGKKVGDCVIRGISKVTGQEWPETYMEICVKGYLMNDMPSSNSVWAAYLAEKGFKKEVIPDTCPDCYTVADFCEDHPAGTYILGTGTHVVAVEDGNYYDAWDSGQEVPIYVWERKVNYGI